MSVTKQFFGVIILDTHVKIVKLEAQSDADMWLEFTIDENDGNGRATCNNFAQFGDWLIFPITYSWDWREGDMSFIIRHAPEGQEIGIHARMKRNGPSSYSSIEILLEMGLTEILQITKKCNDIFDYYRMKLKEHDSDM